VDILVHGDGFAGLALAEAHEALVDCDADEPGRELGVSLELLQLLVSLEECILRDVFGVFTVLSNMLRYAEDLALVLPDELLESSRIPLFRARYERYVGVDLFRSWRLDGGHVQKGSKTRPEYLFLKRRKFQYLPIVNVAGVESKGRVGSAMRPEAFVREDLHIGQMALIG
jgi:hypothetical protein